MEGRRRKSLRETPTTPAASARDNGKKVEAILPFLDCPFLMVCGAGAGCYSLGDLLRWIFLHASLRHRTIIDNCRRRWFGPGFYWRSDSMEPAQGSSVGSALGSAYRDGRDRRGTIAT